MDKKIVAQSVVEKIEQDFRNAEVRTGYLNGYRKPEKISFKGKDQQYTPDIVTRHDESVDLYEIELDPDLDESKWVLFSIYAQKRSGNLYLVVPNRLRDTIKEKLKKRNINAGLLYFNE
jgi:hypothetical protein